MIVFRIHCNFFIVLPIRLKTYRSVFLFFIRQIGRARKIGPPIPPGLFGDAFEKN